ncbi:hypothetical protein [Bacillus sp. AK031]
MFVVQGTGHFPAEINEVHQDFDEGSSITKQYRFLILDNHGYCKRKQWLIVAEISSTIKVKNE